MSDSIECTSITPRKRKRLTFLHQESLDANSSSKCPRTTNAKDDKTNNIFIYNTLMETKSIEELAQRHQLAAENPYEVLRKPPKKKAKHHIEDACFTNEALNIDGPETVVNPYEVKRNDNASGGDDFCFHNPGLNMKMDDHGIGNKSKVLRHENCLEINSGIVNPSLEIEETARVIAIPFTPTVGCRIDFRDISLNELTPSSLLNKTLVFTPEKPKEKKATAPSHGLPIISEESVDIDEELDCYQLELENSINENKSLADKSKRKTLKVLGKNMRKDNSLISPQSIIYEECCDELNNTLDDDVKDNGPINPFVRQYRQSGRRNPTARNNGNKENDGFRQSIRKSFRKLLNNINEPKPLAKTEETNSKFMSNLRQSFRQKSSKQIPVPMTTSHDISILIEQDRKVFKQIDAAKENLPKSGGEDSTYSRNGLRSSIRKTTRNVMRSVFKKDQGYRLD